MTTTTATTRVDEVVAESAAGRCRWKEGFAHASQSILTALQKTSVCHIPFPDVKGFASGRPVSESADEEKQKYRKVSN
jgi:hypothetical protein